MKKKLILLIITMILLLSASLVFASDEDPEPKGIMPEFYKEHHSFYCNHEK